MKYCPNCYDEFLDNIQICAQCKIDLLNGEPTTEEKVFRKINRNPGLHNFVKWGLLFLGISFAISALNPNFYSPNLWRISYLLFAALFGYGFYQKRKEYLLYSKISKQKTDMK